MDHGGTRATGRGLPVAVRVRVRLSTGARDGEVSVGARQPVSALLRLLVRPPGGVVPAGARVRPVYLGRVLEPNNTLEAQGWKVGDVLSALVAEGTED